MTSTVAPRNSFILVLQSSCQTEMLGESAGNNQDTKAYGLRHNATTTVDDWVYSCPISCNILLLPELPSQDDQPDVVQFQQNQMNPCGLSNILLLENLPASWNKILLSLTSCVMMHEDVYLPINALPSTFDFRVDENAMADLHFIFDVSEARLRLEDHLLEQEDDTISMVDLEWNDENELSIPISHEKAAENEKTRTPIMEHDNPPALSHRKMGTDDNFESIATDPLSHTHMYTHGKFESIATKSRYDECPATSNVPPVSHEQEFYFRPRHSTRLDQEMEALQRVQAIMEQDSANLDRLIQVLSFVGLGLFLALLWSGYQFYRAKLDDQHAHNLRTSIERKIRIQSAFSHSMSLNRRNARSQFPPCIPQKAESIKKSPETTELCTPRIDNRSRSRISLATSIAPTRLDFSLDTSEHEDGDQSSSSFGKMKVASNDGAQLDNVSTTKSLPVVVPLSPCSTTTNPFANFSNTRSGAPSDDVRGTVPLFGGVDRKEGNTTTTNPTFGSSVSGSSMVPDANTLSPCSKLAETWAAKKTFRRSNRKKQQSKKFHPQKGLAIPTLSFQPEPDSIWSTQSLLPTFPLRPFGPINSIESTDKSARKQESMFQIPIQTNVNPFLSKQNQNYVPKSSEPCVDQDAQVLQVPSIQTPTIVAPLVPDLVFSTPGSDDSFVDDYW